MTRFILALFSVLCLCSANASAQERADNPQPFGLWLMDFKKDALAQGITQATLDDAFANTEVMHDVVDLDRKQPETTITFAQYLTRIVNQTRINNGRDEYANNEAILKEIGAKYNVQPQFIVALWGIETNFGENTGNFTVVDTLATLAYDGRRAAFFRDELIKALRILQQEHMSAIELQGSWAGALGQCQFMPSSFLQYAVDYDGDGKHDIWNSQEDVFASIANYLHSSGWKGDEGWGMKVKLPAGFDKSIADIKVEKPIGEWNKLGVRTLDGSPLPAGDTVSSLILVGEGDDAVAYVVFTNYKVLLKWNRSRFFATSVSYLADQIGS